MNCFARHVESVRTNPAGQRPGFGYGSVGRCRQPRERTAGPGARRRNPRQPLSGARSEEVQAADFYLFEVPAKASPAEWRNHEGATGGLRGFALHWARPCARTAPLLLSIEAGAAADLRQSGRRRGGSPYSRSCWKDRGPGHLILWLNEMLLRPRSTSPERPSGVAKCDSVPAASSEPSGSSCGWCCPAAQR